MVTQSKPLSGYTLNEVVEQGEALYEAGIRQQVEPGKTGKLLMIDVETGEWVIGTDRREMAARGPKTQTPASTA